MMIDRITARGRSRPGLADSPPSCTACSKPSSEKMIPAGRVSRMFLIASWLVKKPPPAWPKFEPWKCPISRIRTVTTGTATFQLVIALLILAKKRMPTRLMITNRSSRIAAARYPKPCSVPPAVPAAGLTWKMAMSIGGEYRPEYVRARHLDRMFDEAGLGAAAARRRLRGMARDAPGAARNAREQLIDMGWDAPILARIVELIDEPARSLLDLTAAKA